MFRKSFHLIFNTLLFLAFISACVKPADVAEINTSTAISPQEPEVPTSTIQPTEKVVVPTPTTEELIVTETEVSDLCANSSEPCECLGERYKHAEVVGEIIEDYIGSWHAAAFVGSAYNERFVLFSSGNYLFFPSQYECDFGDSACTPSPIEEGIWGIQEGVINLAKEGDMRNVRNILIGKIIDSSPDESPYPLKTSFDGTTYWLLSKDTNLWNPETGELCDG